MADNGTLSRNQRRLVAALTRTASVRAAAETASVGERTAWRYLADPAVRSEVAKRTDAAMSQATAGLAEDMIAARVVLREIITNTEHPVTPRVSAARAILEAGLRMLELANQSDRMARIEERLAALEERGVI